MINSPKATNTLDFLQLFRGLAALGVVFHHATQSVNAFSSQKIPDAFSRFFDYGYLGVDFFFVLSGFIILKSHLDDDTGWRSARVYFLKRVLRIFPPYLPISLLLLIAYAALPGFSAGARGEISIVSSIFLLPSANPPALSVAWTLIHEMLFYFIFLLFFVEKRLFGAVIFAWAASMAYIASTAEGQEFNPLFARLLNPINLEFVMGMACALVWKKIGVNDFYGFASLLAGLIALPILMLGGHGEENRVFYGLPFSLMVLGGSMLSGRFQSSVPSTGILLGDSSYAIYLTHNPLQSLTSRLARHFSATSSWWMMLFFGVVASIIVGIVYHKFFEKPVIQRLKRRMSGYLKP